MARSTPSSRPASGVTPRAIVLGLALIPLNAYWVVVAELRWYMILTLNPLFVTPIFFLLVLVAVSAALGYVRAKWRFSTGELLTVYVMLAISCTVATLDYIVNWVRMVGWGAWFATPENRWAEVVFPHVPRWTLMWDETVLRGFFEGGSTLYHADVLLAWARPLSAWIAFMLVSFGVMFCLTAMVRRAWIEETKLSFPIVRLPLGLVGLEAPRFFRSPVMWTGAGLAMVSGALNGLATVFPAVPHFSTSARFPQFTTPPWNALGWMPTSLYPFAIGLAYFVPLDVLFSCWFFYLVLKAQSVLGYAVGLTNLPGFPFPAEQAIGAWLTYALLLLWAMRGHWRRLVGRLRDQRSAADEHELLPYRWAFVGGALLLVLLIGFWRAIGMRLLPAVVALGVYFLLSLAISRVRAETGAPHDVVSLEPMNLFRLVDGRLLSQGDVVGAGLSHWFWRFNRSHPMPTQLEALKLWHAAGLNARALVWPMAAATLVSCLAAPWAALHVAYRDGASAKCMGFLPLTGQEMWGYMARALTEPQSVEWPRLAAAGGGSLLVLLLWSLQTRYTWIWLHPLGYCIGPSLNWVWFPFAIAWFIKGLIVRYGGQSGYRRLTPFFLGLVLGDYLTGAVWALISPALGFQGYHIFH